MVVVTSPELIDEVRLAKSSDLSLSQLLGQVCYLVTYFTSLNLESQFLAAKYTVGEEVETNPYHISVIHSLTKTLEPHLDELQEEVVASFNDLIPISCDGRPQTAILYYIEHL